MWRRVVVKDAVVIDTKPHAPPFAGWISKLAAARFEVNRSATPPAGDIAVLRSHYDAINAARLVTAIGRYPVAIAEQRMGGIDVHRVTPPAPQGDGDLLVCLHGGAFAWGSGAGALVEAIPVAATSGLAVVAVDYRLAPEHPYPAAVDDVMAVLAALRAEMPQRRIGLFGCSAGAVLAGQVVARLVRDRHPLPAAIAMLHGAGLDLDGDSLALAAQLNGTPSAAQVQRLHDLPYFMGTDPGDPLVFPGNHPEILAHFPPALLISGSRDLAASSVSIMHRRLCAAGCQAESVMFDGMWHAHHVDVDLPESAEVFALLSRFFRRFLR